MPKHKSSKTQRLRRWAFTKWLTEEEVSNTQESVNELKQCLKQGTRRWVFQLEKGEESQKLHFQGRVSFKESLTKSEALKRFKPLKGKQVHLSVESAEEASTFYCMKDDRVEGPWSDKDRKMIAHWDVEYNDFQKDIMERLAVQGPRKILFVVDKNGGIGKTTLAMNLHLRNLAVRVPPMDSFQDIMSFLIDFVDRDNKKILIIDIPRAMRTNWRVICQSVEEIKNGFFWDKRYRGRTLEIPPPPVLVFSNTCPPLDQDYLTLNRWDILTIS